MKELPILYPFDPDKPIYLIFDGSRNGVGWVWLNLHKSDADRPADEESVLADIRKTRPRTCLRPFAFGALSTTPSMQSFTASELEIVTLVRALTSQADVLGGWLVHVVSDNAFVVYIKN